ncbi:Rha family transcriptional regulator, partial [Paenibacillus alvei]
MNKNQFNSAMQGWMDTQRNKEILFVDNGRVVTDSLTVAEVFEKAHDKVLRDIRGLGCSDDFRLSNFGESTYINGQGREMPKYLITEQGFTLLAMGYTGQRAMEFKERYISEFDRMRQQLQSGVPSLSPNQAMAIALQQTAEMMTKVP